MATVTVSTSKQLVAALNAATKGTVIELSSGTYSITLKNTDYHGATITAAAGSNAFFSGVTLTSVSNLHFNDVDFTDSRQSDVNLFKATNSSNISVSNATLDGNVDSSGVGRGTGVSLSGVDDFVFENSTISGFKRGAWIAATSDLTFRNNQINDISEDGMIVAGVHGALFEGNTIDLKIPAGLKHTDGMQFYNSGTNDPLSDLVIRGNHIETHNKNSHGIYVNNEIAMQTGKASAFFHDVTIEGNTIVSGQVSGIAVGQTNGLTIHGNAILQDPGYPSSQLIYIPVIRVNQASTDVSITGNDTHIAPAASGANWAPVKGLMPAGWTVSGNTIVPVGTTVADLAGSNPDPVPGPPPPGNGVADLFRFDAVGPTDVVDGLNFAEGDVIELYNYKGGTFYNHKDANDLRVTINGAVIDSLADIRELDSASAKVHVRDAGNDTLAIDIEQKAGVHTIELHDMAKTYFDFA